MWADAAKALQKMDDFVVQHPKLSALMSHAGSIAGGSMWLKNLTPAGLASYLLANYGYNKIMKLAGGSLEKGKERLAQFFIKHDEEITSGQAAYLANFAMTLLTDVGGRMVFHQVAAKGFNKARKGGSGREKGIAKGAGKAVKQEKAQIGTKLEYIFGRSTGPVHNVERSRAMLKQLQSVGIYDNKAGRFLLRDHLKDVYGDTKGILQSNGRHLRESILMGPNGALKVESVWEGNKLITVTLFGGK